MATGLKCPRCKSKRIWRKGVVPTLHGDKPRLVCFDCGKTFYPPGTPDNRIVSKYTLDPSAEPV